MNNAVELHDSRIGEITYADNDLRIVFRPAYVHRSDGRPGIDSGWVYRQAVEFVFHEAIYSKAGDCTGTVSNGEVIAESAQYLNVIPVPLIIAGAIAANLEFATGGVLRISARGLTCAGIGEPDHNFRERYEA